jgi:hypothetical protein
MQLPYRRNTLSSISDKKCWTEPLLQKILLKIISANHRTEQVFALGQRMCQRKDSNGRTLPWIRVIGTDIPIRKTRVIRNLANSLHKQFVTTNSTKVLLRAPNIHRAECRLKRALFTLRPCYPLQLEDTDHNSFVVLAGFPPLPLNGFPRRFIPR